jgi:hypothetical protein
MPCLLSEEQKENHVTSEFQVKNKMTAHSLLTRFSTVRLLPFPKTQDDAKGKES